MCLGDPPDRGCKLAPFTILVIEVMLHGILIEGPELGYSAALRASSERGLLLVAKSHSVPLPLLPGVHPVRFNVSISVDRGTPKLRHTLAWLAP